MKDRIEYEDLSEYLDGCEEPSDEEIEAIYGDVVEFVIGSDSREKEYDLSKGLVSEN